MPWQGQHLNALFKGRRNDDAVDVDARHVDVVRVQAADGDNLFDFGNSDLGSTCHRGIEVACGLAKHQVTGLVRLPGLGLAADEQARNKQLGK